MVDLTGGVVEMVDLRNPPSNLFSVMKKAYRRAALMGCAIEVRRRAGFSWRGGGRWGMAEVGEEGAKFTLILTGLFSIMWKLLEMFQRG